MTVILTEYSTHLQFFYTVKVSKGRVETLISSSINQNGDIKCDLLGWVKVKILSPLHVGDPIPFPIGHLLEVLYYGSRKQIQCRSEKEL